MYNSLNNNHPSTIKPPAGQFFLFSEISKHLQEELTHISVKI